MDKRWDLFLEMKRMQDEMDAMFYRMYKGQHDVQWPLLLDRSQAGMHDIAPLKYREPLSDFFETEKEIVATLELPGVSKEDIHIHAAEGRVEIQVEKKDQHAQEDKKKGIYRSERSYRGFYRSFSLPKSADPTKIDATYKNGVLELRIAKRSEKEQNIKRIEVK